jgi:hypothetical protein
MPGLHVLASLKQERRGWPGRSPAMTKSESFSSGQKDPENIDCFFSQTLRMRLEFYPGGVE